MIASWLAAELVSLLVAAPSPDCSAEGFSQMKDGWSSAGGQPVRICIGVAPITQAEWKRVLAAAGEAKGIGRRYPLPNRPAGELECDECPVDTVDWYEAMMFANLLSALEQRSECYRLRGCAGAPWPEIDRDDRKFSLGALCNAVERQESCTGYRLPTLLELRDAFHQKKLSWDDNDGREWALERAPPNELEAALAELPVPDNLFRRTLFDPAREREAATLGLNPSVRANNVTFRLVRGTTSAPPPDR